jgi:Terpene cyclase DEP1
MRLRHLYLALCVFGVVVPYAQFVPWLSQNGLQLGLFLRELFATRVGAFFGLDVVVSAVVLFVFICAERKTVAIRHAWLPIIATLLVGVSLGLPLFLYMRQRVLDAATV